MKNIKHFQRIFNCLTAVKGCRIEGISHDATLLHYGNMPMQYTVKLKAAFNWPIYAKIDIFLIWSKH